MLFYFICYIKTKIQEQFKQITNYEKPMMNKLSPMKMSRLEDDDDYGYFCDTEMPPTVKKVVLSHSKYGGYIVSQTELNTLCDAYNNIIIKDYFDIYPSYKDMVDVDVEMAGIQMKMKVEMEYYLGNKSHHTTHFPKQVKEICGYVCVCLASICVGAFTSVLFTQENHLL